MRRATWLALFAALALLLAPMLACGGGGSVKFGAVLPLTGSAEVYGKSIQQGIDLAVEQANAKREGEGEPPIEVEVQDSASDPTQAATQLRELYSGGVIAAIGGVTSQEALAMAPVADSADKVLLSPTASSAKLSDISRAFFRIFPSADTETVAISNHTISTLQVQRVAVMAEDTAFGEGLASSFQQSFERAGGTIAGTVTFTGADDVGAAADQVIQLEKADKTPFAVFVAAAGSNLADAIRTLRDHGYGAERGNVPKSRVLASSALASPEVLQAAGGAAEFVYFAQTPYDPKSDQEPMRSFVQAFKAKFSQTPDFYAAHGYDSVQVLLAALKEAGGAGALPSDLMRGMRAIANLPGVTGSIQFRETGDVQKFMRIHLVADGQPRDFDEYMTNRRQEAIDKLKDLERKQKELEAKIKQSDGQ